jgi:hypothetical protein
MVKPGRPFETWTSTEMGVPSAPLRVAEATVASMWGNGRMGESPQQSIFWWFVRRERLATQVAQFVRGDRADASLLAVEHLEANKERGGLDLGPNSKVYRFGA